MDSNRTSRGRDRAAIRQRASMRDRGLEVVARANRWMIAGGLAVTGGVAALADHAFHAQQAARAASLRATSRGAGAAAPSAGTSTAATGVATTGTSTTGTATTGTGTSTAGGGTATTSTAPAPAPAASAPSAVVSGGS